MKAARLVVLGIALVAGIGAAMLAGRSNDPTPVAAAPEAKSIETVEVLVANSEIALGAPLAAGDLRWQEWPKSAANAAYIERSASPNAQQDWTGAIARSPFFSGEPIRPDKLIKGSGAGYMAAILPAGMRAISIEISAETGAGGFILPNDRVDVILSRKVISASGESELVSATIAQNIRVLAIDQTVADQDGQKVVVGKTATLELSPRQSEQIALSRSQGSLSLALRALVDSNPNATPDKPANDVMTVRYGKS